MATLRIGTCSWKYPSWAGIVYSAEKNINYLAEYAARFDTVEIDQWFWSLLGPDRVSLPRPEVVREYAAAVPPSFRFTVKAPDSVTLTHVRRKGAAAPLVENPHFLSPELFFRFLDSLSPMHGLLGPVMLQFEYLNRQKMASQRAFLDRLGDFLAAMPRDIPLGIESRNPNYLSRPYFDLLAAHGVAHVFLQGYYMPPVWDVAARPGALPRSADPRSDDPRSGDPHSGDPRAVTAAAAPWVIRLHGPDRAGIEERSGGMWNRIVEARDEELTRVAALARALLAREVDVFLNVNNHYEGSAPLSIVKVRALLGLE